MTPEPLQPVPDSAPACGEPAPTAVGERTLLQMARYVLVGGAATAVDWGVYYLCAIVAALHYQVSLVIAQVLAGAVHYVLNKTFTFRCTSRQIVKQIGAYVLVALAYLLLSMVVMYLLVDLLGLDKMVSRVATTGIMILVSFFLHRAVTFNERFFAREGPGEGNPPRG